MRVRLSRDADSDLAGILQWGAEHFGATAALDYYAGLERLFDLLADHPAVAAEIRAGVRAHPYRSHVVVYREHGGKLEILGVPHARSNWRKHL